MRYLLTQAIAQWLTDFNVAYSLEVENCSEILCVSIPNGLIEIEIGSDIITVCKFDPEPDDPDSLAGGEFFLIEDIEDPTMLTRLHTLLTELGVATNDQHA